MRQLRVPRADRDSNLLCDCKMADATLENEARKVQRIELSSRYMDSNPLYCLFCGEKVLDLSQSVDAGSPYMNLCRHTLYIATDEGFERCSSRAQALFGVSEDGELDYDEETDGDPLDEGWDGLTGREPFQNAVKIASYTPAPSGMGCYICFVADEA